MDISVVIWLIVGFGLLTVGGELLVRGASNLASIMGLSPLVIGLTVVAFGTSSPELAVSLKSALGGQADLAVGNVVGSNIFNILVIIGTCAVIVPLRVNQQLIRFDVPVMIVLSILLYFFTMNGEISRPEGAFLFLLLIGYIAFAVITSRKESKAIHEEYAGEYPPVSAHNARVILLQTAFIAGGVVLLVFGSRFLVDSASSIARFYGVGELVIGLTIVAVGTSLPEVAASVIAALKDERDIAVGNAVGSCIFNILCVLGLTASLTPVPVAAQALQVDLPIMIFVAALCAPVFYVGALVTRLEGSIFLLYYFLYTFYLVLGATDRSTTELVSITLWGVIPLTMFVIFIRAIREFKVRPGHT